MWQGPLNTISTGGDQCKLISCWGETGSHLASVWDLMFECEAGAIVEKCTVQHFPRADRQRETPGESCRFK